jgi:hypothetical protein
LTGPIKIGPGFNVQIRNLIKNKLHDTYLKGKHMNIIFGESIKDIPDSFTVLELDTFNIVAEHRNVTAYCVIEKIPLGDFDKLDAYKKVHADLIENYRRREWTYCEHAIEGLMGKWNGELDTFYANLLLRVLECKTNGVSDDWNGIVNK